MTAKIAAAMTEPLLAAWGCDSTPSLHARNRFSGGDVAVVAFRLRLPALDEDYKRKPAYLGLRHAFLAAIARNC